MPKIRTAPCAITALVGLALPLAGCRVGGGHAVSEPQPTPSLAPQPQPQPALPAWAQGPTLDLERIIDRAQPEEPIQALPAATVATPIAPAVAAPGSVAEPSIFEMAPAAPGLLATILATNTPAEAAPAGAPKPLPAQIEENAITLMGLLAQQMTEPDTAWKAYLAMAALDLVRPGSMPQVISPDLKGAAVLTAEEVATADTIRQFLADLATLPGDASPQTRSAKLAEWAQQIAGAAPMRVTGAALCGRVMGYGQYLPLGTGKFLQGRPQRAIVYVEVANFAQRPLEQSQTGDRWVVNLSQALQLYHDADGTLTWSRPEEEVIETSRNKRRDFYLVNDITLPPTLTIGAYRLKIIMRDKVSGQVDEHVIPFEVVADPALALGAEGSK